MRNAQGGTGWLRKLRVFFAFGSLVFGLGALRAAEVSGFLGWIPVQYAPAGSTLTLDMHRFFHPAAGETLRVFPALGDEYQVSFDADRFEVKVTVGSKTKGLLDIPLAVGSGQELSGRTGVLTIAVEAPGAPAGSDIPSVYAATQTSEELTFQIIPAAGIAISGLSAVLEVPDGSSRTVPFKRDSNMVRVSTGSAPDGSWVRLAVSDERGRVSRAIRAQVRPKKEFQWQDGIIYYAFTDRFANGSPANDRAVEDAAVLPQANYFGGDFSGIQKRIEDGYFQKLGVNVLWLAPLNRNPDGAWTEYLPPYRSYTGYHGYWPVSHTEVEPRFGGNQGLKDLVGTAQKSGIKIIADLVLKHVHVEHPLWKEQPEWFGSLTLPDGKKNLRLWDEQQFTTWFEEWLPGFDFDKPEPVAFLLGNARYWIEEFGLDGYRLDAVKHIKYSFWPKFRTTMRELQERDALAPMYFVGETFMDRPGIMSFVGPNMLDGQFDFPLYDTLMEVFAKGTQGFAALEKSLSESETIYGKETLMSPLIGNHDKSRFMAFADGDLPKSEKDDEEEIGWADPPRVDKPVSYEKLKLALGFILSIDGVPMIYYGDEVGLTGAGDPDNRRMMPAESELAAEQRRVREYLGKVAALRSAHPALRYGNRRLLVADDTRYAFVRRHFEDQVLAVWNKGSGEARFEIFVGPELPDGRYTDALSGLSIAVEEGRTEFTLGSMESAFFTAERPKP